MKLLIKNHDSTKRYEIVMRHDKIKRVFKVPVGMAMPIQFKNKKFIVPFNSVVTGDIDGKAFTFTVDKEDGFVFENSDIAFDNS